MLPGIRNLKKRNNFTPTMYLICNIVKNISTPALDKQYNNIYPQKYVRDEKAPYFSLKIYNTIIYCKVRAIDITLLIFIEILYLIYLVRVSLIFLNNSLS